VTNHGPWSVSDARVRIEWPYEVQSPYARGKWALYLMTQPVMRITRPGHRTPHFKLCTLELVAERVNPLELLVSAPSSFSLSLVYACSKARRSPAP